ncbi:MAG: hypothetical protein JSU72_10970 [Deltaproteobacteria bacterium]|nr:MAG: hypothetical protein JSU72_10970 [Deltaproteobacteria bacterium]
MRHQLREIRKIEVGKVVHNNIAGQENLYVRIGYSYKEGETASLMFEKVEFSCTNTTDFLTNLASLAGTIAGRVTPNTTLIVKELTEEEISIVARAWQMIQR